jgi:glycosyltransferase involved in cell wall biosynthesis
MKILTLTNFYPPYEIGGEEQSCLDVMDQLSARGHQIHVLTSQHGAAKHKQVRNIYRLLHLEMPLNAPLYPLRFLFLRRWDEYHNLSTFRRLLKEIQPDIIFIWGMWNIHRSLSELAEQLYPGRVLYRFGDYWPSLPSQALEYWHVPGKNNLLGRSKKWLAPIFLSLEKRSIQQPKLRLEHAYCITEGMRQEMLSRGIDVSKARIINNALDTTKFSPGPRQLALFSGNIQQSGGKIQPGLKFLYAGRVDPDKGVHIAIEAFGMIQQQISDNNASLRIVGKVAPEYAENLNKRIRSHNLVERVLLQNPVPKDEMPELLKSYDILLVPSIWPEPFGRIVIEAMATGLTVLASSVGGIPEIIEDGKSGLLFCPEDPSSLANQIMEIFGKPGLRKQIGEYARNAVEARFAIPKMIDQVEAFLREMAG